MIKYKLKASVHRRGEVHVWLFVSVNHVFKHDFLGSHEAKRVTVKPVVREHPQDPP